MAARYARFAARGFSSIRSAPRLCTRGSVKMSGEQTSLVRRCRTLVPLVGVKSLQSNNLVQIATRKLSQYTPIVVSDVSSIINNNSSGTSEALEESSTECDDEATNGRKRIKPHELQRDDP